MPKNKSLCELNSVDVQYSGQPTGYRWWPNKSVVERRRKLLPRTDIFSTSERYGRVIADNFPDPLYLDSAIISTKEYYMSLRQDGTDISKRNGSSFDSDTDSEVEEFFGYCKEDSYSGTNGAPSLTIVAHHRNNLF